MQKRKPVFTTETLQINLHVNIKKAARKQPAYILYHDQQMHNYFTNYHTPTCIKAM